jgi:hypothetical protein
MVAATDEVIRTLPSPLATMPGRTRLARCTAEVTLTSIRFRSASSGISVKAPLTPAPAFSATAASGRPAAVTAAQTRSTPS